jgi:hypothetical protein
MSCSWSFCTVILSPPRIRSLKRGLQAHGVGLAAGGQLALPLERPVALGAAEAERLHAARLGLGAHRGQLLLVGEGQVGVARLEELLDVGLVEALLVAQRLHVGAVGAADVGALVPVDADPAQRGHDVVGCALDEALLVGVLDAQDELAAVVARGQPVEEGGAHPADVQVAGGAGREAHAHRAGDLSHSSSSPVWS